MSRKRIILIIVLFLAITISGYYIYQFVYRIDKTEVTISVSTPGTQVVLNGNQINTSSVYLKSGKYNISVTKAGYYEFRNEYDINKSNNKISVTLKQKPAEYISSLLRGSDYNTVISKYPILKKLPFTSPLLNITYTDNSTLDKLVLSVDAYDGYKQGAIEKIKIWGYNPADYNIKFNDYTNPFAL